MNKKVPILIGISVLLLSGIVGMFAALRTPGAPSSQNSGNQKIQKVINQAGPTVDAQKKADAPKPTKSTKAS